jgi:serine/threonine-protein kinase HipA
VGELAEHERRLYFQYDEAFLESGIELSPFKLRARRGVIEHTDRAFGPLFGVFDDSLPDGWGLVLMDRAFKKSGKDPDRVSPLDRLAWLGSRAMGALVYEPPLEGEDEDDALLDLERLGRSAEALVRGETTQVSPQLIRAGGSPAGARPKAVIGIRGTEIVSGAGELPADFEPWIVKFAGPHEEKGHSRIELAYASMARAAGIHVPESRLLFASKKVAYFASRRFDRPRPGERLHMHTLANLLHADFRIPSLDYDALVQVTTLLTRNHADVHEAFRRMLFNVAAHNRDDHAKNFAFLMSPDGVWSLAPAYDLTASKGPGGEHTMAVGGEALAPTREHALRVWSRVGDRKAAFVSMVEQVNDAVAAWPDHADAAGCTKAATRRVATLHRTL